MANAWDNLTVFSIAVFVLTWFSVTLDAADCNRNGEDDGKDLLAQDFGFLAASYGIGGRVIAKDFDGDGAVDIASATRLSVSILINRRDGTFSEPKLYMAAGYKYHAHITTADFNGDGLPDIATAGFNPQWQVSEWAVSVLLAQSSETFSEAANYPTTGGCWSSLISADLNGDGFLDLATLGRPDPQCSTASSVISGLLNQGDGSFHMEHDDFEPPRSMDLSGMIAADLDENGREDLIAAAPSSGTVLVWFDYDLTGALEYPVPGRPSVVLAGDIDGDASLDLIVAGGEDSPDTIALTILRKIEAQRFRDVVSHQIPARGQNPDYLSLLLADLNGDGRPDLVCSQGSEVYPGDLPGVPGPRTVSVLLNASDGMFEPASIYSSSIGYWSEELAAADLDGDGALDLVLPGPNVLRNEGTGKLREALTYSPAASDSFAIADFDGNGSLDIAASFLSGGGVNVLLNHTTPPFSLDGDHNGIPDECEAPFHRADPNSSGTTDLSDAIAIFGYLFLGSESPACLESADVNNDAAIDISDGIAVLNWLFTGGPEPTAPGPAQQPCGLDPDASGSPGDLGCLAYDHCQ